MKTPNRLEGIENELQAARADALSRVAGRMRRALEALRAFEARFPEGEGMSERDRERRRELVAEAAEKVWFLVVQRESLGLDAGAAFLDENQVPRHLRCRLGPKTRSPGSRDRGPSVGYPGKMR